MRKQVHIKTVKILRSRHNTLTLKYNLRTELKYRFVSTYSTIYEKLILDINDKGTALKMEHSCQLKVTDQAAKEGGAQQNRLYQG